MIGGPFSGAPEIMPSVGAYFAGVSKCSVAFAAAFFALGLWNFAGGIAWLSHNPTVGDEHLGGAMWCFLIGIIWLRWSRPKHGVASRAFSYESDTNKPKETVGEGGFFFFSVMNKIESATGLDINGNGSVGRPTVPRPTQKQLKAIKDRAAAMV